MRTSLSKKIKIKMYLQSSTQKQVTLTNLFKYLTKTHERFKVGDWTIQSKNRQISSP